MLSACLPGSSAHTETLAIETRLGRVDFTTELAITPKQQAIGLMNRHDLPANHGMLFVFPSPRHASFWMRGTLIPLDMIFVRSDGTIARIHHNAQPLDETPVPSGEPVKAVFEIAGGEAMRLGISEGDTVRHTVFGNVLAE
jgi:uncharacterized membrane protein (UPF0127 family)